MFPSLHPNCHHPIVFAKSNSNIHYPPPYYCQVCHYQDVDTRLIRPEIDLSGWKKVFANTSVDENAAIFNKSIRHILHDFIPHEIFLVDDKDPTWLTNIIKKIITKKA